MSTRKQTKTAPNLADLESAANPTDAPGIMPPPGIEARVRTTIDYQRTIDPDDPPPAYDDNLRQLAADELDNDDLPQPELPVDPLTAFCSTWRNFAGYPLKIVRHPDPANRRMPGQSYNRPCFEIEALGSIPFEPVNLIPTLQLLNGNSGGAFRLFLTDDYGVLIPEARLERVVIPDPPKQHRDSRLATITDDYDLDRRFRRERDIAPPAPPQKSEMELRIEKMQSDLFERVMMRALDPPAPPPVDPMANISTEDRLALGLLQRGDVLESVISRITSLAQAPDKIESATWKDRLVDAGIGVVTQNPQIIATVTDIASRTIAMIAQAFTPRTGQVVAEPIPVTPPVQLQHPPAQRSAQQLRAMPATTSPAATVNTGLPEVPDPDDDFDDDDPEVDMMEEITKLLLSDKPLSFQDPVILDLRAEYTTQFDAVLAGIAKMPSMVIIQLVCSKSEFCADMFTGAVTGPHLRKRLEELKALIASALAPEVMAVNTKNDDAKQETDADPAATEPQS